LVLSSSYWARGSIAIFGDVVIVVTSSGRLLNRLLKVDEDYDVKDVSIQSDANAVTLGIEFPEYDRARLRRLAYKPTEKNYITVSELMELHKAGFRSQEDRKKLLFRPMRYRRRENVLRAVFNQIKPSNHITVRIAEA